MKIGPDIAIKVDRSSSIPLARQITNQIADKIAAGLLDHDQKLPSTRLLSKELGVNRTTVSTAYRRLESSGLVRSGVGSGTYIIASNRSKSKELDQSIYQPIFSKGVDELRRHQAALPDLGTPEKVTHNFAALFPDDKLFPVEQFRQCMNAVLERDGGRALQYCGTLGFRPLREYVANRMPAGERAVDPDSLLFISGAQQGVALVFRCFLSPGDKVIVGSPTYHNIFPLLRQLQAEIETVPVLSTGLDTDALAEAARDPAVRLIYTMPNFQNPTGVTADAANRRRVLKIAQASGITVLEDDFQYDLGTESGEMPPAMRSLDPEGRVIYLSTFSKSLFPALRIGWLEACDKIFPSLVELKKASDLENSALLQRALFEFCTRGFYEKHLEKVRNLIRRRLDTAFQALAEFMPSECTWHEPRGGYVFWVRLPEGVRSERIHARAGQKGVLVSPGTLFLPGGADPGAIRLSVSLTRRDAIREGIKILGTAVTEEIRSSRSARTGRSETPQLL